MKNIDLKTPNFKSPALTRVLPYMLTVLFFAIGLVLIGFGYFLFTRQPEAEVILNAQKEVDEISIKFDKNTTMKLFDSSYDVSKINDPGYKTKNPFLSF